MKEITIPGSVTKIGDEAFCECRLEAVILSEGVKEIGQWSFYACENLKKIAIPTSVTTIGGGAFLGCEKLEETVMPDSVTKIGEKAFGDCKSLVDQYALIASPHVGISEFCLSIGSTSLIRATFVFASSLS